jgi:hypothetical protein
LTTLWTGLDFCLMFSDHHLHRWQVKDLPPFTVNNRCPIEIAPTVLTTLYPMNLHLIRVGTHLQRMPFMPWLSTTLLATGLSQTTSAWFLQPVTGRRLAAVVAILG